MRKLALFIVLLCSFVTLRAEEQHITFGELPTNAKIFVLTYFKDIPFTDIYIERRASLMQYEVKLEGGVDLQFDRVGLCTEIDCRHSAVPDEVLPKKIVQTVKKHFPHNFISKYENNGRMYDIKLDNGVVLTFSRTLRLVDIEDEE